MEEKKANQNIPDTASGKIGLLLKNYSSVICVIIIVLFIFTFVIHIGVIPSESMEPTLKKNSFAVCTRVNKKDIKRGNIIIFQKSSRGKRATLIKRVVGIPRDRIEFRNNSLYRNGQEITESYVKKGYKYKDGAYKVPEGKLFVLGDNRNHSYDSRYWKDGAYLPMKNVKGKLLLPIKAQLPY